MIYYIKTFGQLNQENADEDHTPSSALNKAKIREELKNELNDDAADIYEYFDAPLNELIEEIEILKVNKDGSVEWKFKVKRELKPKESKLMLRELEGQCSDGWGEGFEQHPFTQDKQFEYFYSPWRKGKEFRPQILKVSSK